MQVEYDVQPPKSQPALNEISWATQPYWQDVILAAINGQYALWVYPAGPVVSPVANAEVVELPVLQLDSCSHTPAVVTPGAPEPIPGKPFIPRTVNSFFAPVLWIAQHSYASGQVILGKNADGNIDAILVAENSGITGANAPISNLALLWQIWRGGFAEEFRAVGTSPGRRAHEEVKDGLPDGRQAWLWRRSPDSFFSVPRP